MYLYPKWLRLWHLLNAVLFLILIFTGISMQYTDKGSSNFIIGFERAVKWHNIAAVILTINYIFFVLGNVLTRNGKFYRMEKENFSKNLITQLKFYAGG